MSGSITSSTMKPPDHVESVHVREHHIEHDEVGTVPLSGLDCLAAGCRGDHLEAGITQAGGQQLQDVGLILDDQQPCVWRPVSVVRLTAHVSIVRQVAEC